MANEPEQSFEEISATLKKAAAALREAQIPFLLGGSLASWARGGPETRHDLDLMIKPEDAERAQQVLCEHAGMRAERPPEGWLLKAWDGDILVDLIFGPSGMDMTDDVFARGDTLPVLAMDMPVMAMEDMLATKLSAMTEHHIAFEGPLRIARALREQIDWTQVRERTRGNPFAAAFFTLVEELGVVEREPAADAR